MSRSRTTSEPPMKNMQSGPLGPREFDFMWTAHQRLFDQVARMNRIWVDSVTEATRSSSQLTVRLARCESPVQAGAICGEWLRDSGQRFLNDSRRATELWSDFCRALPAVADASEQAKAAADGDHPAAAERRAVAAE
jgi:hypothetical protein